MANKNPMSLENLPDYLKSLKEKGNSGEPCLVDIGQINQPKSFFLQKFLIALVICFSFGITGKVAYNQLSTKEITVVVDMKGNDPLQSIPKLVSDNGGNIVSVTKKDDSIYEVKMTTRKSKRSFLEIFRRNKDVENVQ